MVRRALFACVLVVAAGCVGLPATDSGPTQSTTRDASGTTLVVEDSNGTRLGTVHASVADTAVERYTGLSDTASLGPNEGMWFVYDEEGHHAYVMREMDFPIDIVYVGADGRITAIHHAPVEHDDDLTRYEGRGKWVLEVPYHWTTDHGVEVGDVVRVAG